MEQNLTIIEILRRILEIQEEILRLLKNQTGNPLKGQNDPSVFENLIDSVDVKSILKISDRTLYRIKKSKLISSVRIGKRDYYSLAEIKSITNYFMK